MCVCLCLSTYVCGRMARSALHRAPTVLPYNLRLRNRNLRYRNLCHCQQQQQQHASTP